MKKAIIYLLFLLFTVSINAQVAVLRATVAEITFTEDWSDGETTTLGTPFYVVMNYDEDIISIAEKKFFVKETIHEETTPEGKSEDYTQHHVYMRCINQRGEPLEIIFSHHPSNLIKYAGKYDVRVRVITDNEWIGLYCKLLSLKDESNQEDN